MFKLVIQDDEGKTTVVPLIRDEITIGRKEGNTIRLTERNVSRRHARILRNNGEVQIEDLGSYNGIRVNNARIAERVSLRISDQVQIGDYKLYLKAEGVEQVDDARTMPIERVENGVPATEVMPAITAPTAPIIPATPSPVQRATMGVADTDPAGRPVATAAQVAALTAPAGYGKLCVISSNFAGKEFDLTRPQMIVGRTDENDIVINHRSISRNHAKIVRDPDTQRYTISDLQSSNGVRVNGQDYGKVELRRGDVVDLGHVRLRFVEPGEDFIFSRDAVISEIPDGGSRKGLAIAVVLAILVLGAVGAFFAFKGGDNTKPNDHGGMVEGSGSGGSAVAINDHDHGSGAVVVPEIIDATPGPGPNTVDTSAEAKRVYAECAQIVADASSSSKNSGKWADVKLCADKLEPLDKDKAKQLRSQALAETKADDELGKMSEELGNGSLTKAKKHLDNIPEESAYKREAQGQYDKKEQSVIDDFVAKAQRAKRDCRALDIVVGQAKSQGTRVAQEVAKIKCEGPGPVAEKPDCTNAIKDARDKACVKQFCQGHSDDSHCPNSGGNVTPPPASCSAEELLKLGEQSVALGQHAEALKNYEAANRCKPGDSHIVQLTFMEACNANLVSKAKVYWKKLSADLQNRALQICVRNHITREQLDAP